MKVTKQQISLCYNTSIDNIKQIDSKQLFIVDTSYLGRLLVSYKTTIGIYFDGVWVITLEKFSPATSKQTTQFINANSHLKFKRVSPETFDNFMLAVSR